MTLRLRLSKKHLFLVLLQLCLVLVLSCIYMGLERMPRSGCLESFFGCRKKDGVTVLLWYWPFHVPYSLTGDVCLKNYNIADCHLVDNRMYYSTADIVVFHHHELKIGSQTLPHHLPRPVWQRWLWLSLEAPQNNRNVKQYAGIFNLTMTYHPDADITIPYGEILLKHGDAVADELALPTNKTHLVCWVISNYRNHHRRAKVYKELSKIIPVQVYGRAARQPVTQGALLPTISRCYFYLAFENSESPHYITEKLWRNAFMAGTVPVVLGPPRSHYEAVAPPHSFVHVDDFDSVESLAKYLKELAGDGERYNAYFSWREKYSVKLYADWRERLCKICQVYDTLPNYKIHHTLGA